MNIRDVARAANVSTATVSRVVSGSAVVKEETQERVRHAIEKLGYVPNSNARTLSSGRSHLFGVIISDITNPFFPDLIYTFNELATKHEYGVIFANTNYSTERMEGCIRTMLERNVEGLAIMTSEMSHPLLRQVQDRGIPMIFLDHPVPKKNFSNISVDYRAGVHQAVDHLVQLGHKKIAFIGGPGNLGSALRRRDAFLGTLHERGISPQKAWVLEANHRVDGGHAAMRQLLEGRDQPTAVLASNDLTAIGAISAIYEAGLQVPGDISVVGFDDIEISAAFNPQLTTVRLSRVEIATKAFHALYDASQRPPRHQAEYRVNTELVLRRSTAKPPVSSKVKQGS